MTMSAATGIVAQDVCKSFGDHLVLDKVNLAVERAQSWRFSAPTGLARPRWSASCPP